jgi:hypothetical protein
MLRIKLNSKNAIISLELNRCFIATNKSLDFSTYCKDTYSYVVMSNSELRISFSIKSLLRNNLVKMITIPGPMDVLNIICIDSLRAGFHIKIANDHILKKYIEIFNVRKSRKPVYDAIQDN